MKPKKSFLNLMVITIISGIIFLSSASTALALYYSGGYSLYSMTYAVKTSGHDSLFNTAANNWTTAVGTTIQMNSTSENTVYLQNYPYTWHGLYTPYTSPIKSFRIDVNHRTLYEKYPDNIQNAWISTATHEFGHAQYLANRDTHATSSIMSAGRNRGIMTKPQPIDIQDIQDMRNQIKTQASTFSPNPLPHADWAVYDFDTLIDKVDLIAFVDVYKSEDKKDDEGPPAMLSTLKVTEVLYGSAPSSIILDQALNFVEPGKSYLLFLNKNGDYYYELTEESVIVGNKDEYKVQIEGIEGVYKKRDLTQKLKTEITTSLNNKK